MVINKETVDAARKKLKDFLDLLYRPIRAEEIEPFPMPQSTERVFYQKTIFSDKTLEDLEAFAKINTEDLLIEAAEKELKSHEDNRPDGV